MSFFSERKIIERPYQHQLQFPNFPPFLNDLLQRRAISSEEGLDFSLRHLLPYHNLSHIERATEILAKAILEQRSILLVGDYDVDGATSIALAMRVLPLFGASSLSYRVPHRLFDGYGLTRSLVQKILIEEKPDLIITLDNGISDVEGVALAREAGVEVIITDHHLPPEILPNADAIVNPNLEGDRFESKNLAGVGVIFYLLLSLRAYFIEKGYLSRESAPNLAQYLDLVALGTVADLVPLDENNRRLVQQGLMRMRSGALSAGVAALIDLSGRNGAQLSTADIAFGIAPMLNAAGRLDDMTIGIEALLSDDFSYARSLAEQLYQLNSERKEIERSMRAKADEALSGVTVEYDSLPSAIVLYDEAWHQGVTGIVASRIKEQYYRPTFVFAFDEEGMIKGSGRSIRGIHLRDMISNVARRERGMIATFGGHAMAAGLSLEERYLDQFREMINEEIEKSAKEINEREGGELFEQRLYSDGYLAPEAFTLENADRLRLAFPWGQGFPEPLFEGVFEVLDIRILKEVHVKFLLLHPESGQEIDGIAFFQGKSILDNVEKIYCAYKLNVNEWRGRRSLQLIIDYFEPQ